tara:strand:+ start:1659 stop:3053 length:1395 start_codon:yes stop_codon:yes gene_type:complete
MSLTLGDLKKIWGEPSSVDKVKLSAPLGPACTDTRLLSKGDFFIPLVGEKFNGHNFLSQAYMRGAQAAVIQKDYDMPLPKGLLHWRVSDTLSAFQQLALFYRRDLNIPVVAVTGSVGKTTTREFIREALAPLGFILASSENQNNDVGVPLTLLKAKKSNAVVVLEMGMRGLGEIRRLSCCSEPDVAVITNIGTAHIGRLGSRKNIALAKCEITSFLNPSGVVVIPANDYLLEETLSSKWKGRVVRAGIQDVSANGKNHIFYGSKGIDLLGKVDHKKGIMEVDGEIFQLPLPGRHNAKNLILAIAVAKEFDVSFTQINRLSVHLPDGRNRILQMGEITVLDETYNSSPEAVIASLELLVNTRGRHFAVLGTMLELGEQSVSLHREVIEYAASLKLDGLVFVAKGEEAEAINSESNKFPKFKIVSSPEKALEPIKEWLKNGDTVLLKGSRSIELDRLLPLMRKIYF